MSAVIAVVGCLTLAEYIGDFDFGIDQLLFSDDALATSTSNPGRMAPVTAFCLTLNGLALLLLNRCPRISIRLAMVVLVLAIFGVAGYIFGVQTFYRISAFTSIALHTAIALLLLSLGILAAHPAYGWVEIMASDLIWWGGVPSSFAADTYAALFARLGGLPGYESGSL